MLIETIFDINDERFTVFKQYLLQSMEHIDKPIFTVAYSKYIGHHNAGNHADGLLEWYNFKKAMELKELNHDAMSVCFALLHLEDDEDQRNCSKDFQIRKLNDMRENGLSRGLVEEVVENFMNASPKTFAVYLAMLDLMKPVVEEKFLRK